MAARLMHPRLVRSGRRASRASVRPLAPAADRCAFSRRSRTPEPTLTAERCFLSACSPKARDGSGNREFVDSLAPTCGLGAVESTLARVGPKTPKQFGTKHQTSPHFAVHVPRGGSLAVRAAEPLLASRGPVRNKMEFMLSYGLRLPIEGGLDSADIHPLCVE